MVHFLLGNESEDGDRVSFPRGGKRNVVSHHFTELLLGFTKMKVFTMECSALSFSLEFAIIRT